MILVGSLKLCLKMNFSNVEKRDMLKLYYKFDRNSMRASQMYFEMYPERQQPHRTIFKKLDQNLGEFGAFQQSRLKYGSRIGEETRNNILAEVKLSFVYKKIKLTCRIVSR